MKIYLVQRATLLDFNITYIICYYIVYIIIFLFAFLTHREHKISRRIIEEKNHELQRLNKGKTDFFINVSHEIKTPVSLILNYAEKIIKDQNQSEEIRIIRNNAAKLSRDLLNYLNIEKLASSSEIMNDTLSVLNLSSIIDQVVSLYPIKNFKLKINEMVYIKADPYRIDMLLQNLISNAIKYNDENVLINISLEAKGDLIFLNVSDNGIGVSKDQLPHLFTPFYQAEKEKKNIQGIGLGLSLVKSIIDTLKGEIKVTSEMNEGISYIITLLAYGKKDDELTIEKIDEIRSINNEKSSIFFSETKHEMGKDNLLIVEDDLQMLLFLSNSFQDEYNVYTAKNGFEAIEKLEALDLYNLPRVIISDVMMDVCNGYELFNFVKDKSGFDFIPFIFLTAKEDQNEKKEKLGEGAIDYISKPFSIDVLKAKVKSNINSREKLLDDFLQLQDHQIKYEKYCDNFSLTNREKKIFSLWIIKDYSQSAIADKIGITRRTVERNIVSIKEKTGIYPERKRDKTPFRLLLKDFL